MDEKKTLMDSEMLRKYVEREWRIYLALLRNRRHRDEPRGDWGEFDLGGGG